MRKKTCRILSIDGGGVRGIIPALWLEEIDKIVWTKYRQSLPQHFDYIAGTSAGSIIATSLAAGLQPRQIVHLFENRSREIFPYRFALDPRRLGLIIKYGLSAPRYSDKGLIRVLREEIGTTVVAEVTDTRLLVPFYDTIKRDAEFVKSYHDAAHRNHLKFGDVPLWEVAVCSASGPTYFPAHPLRTAGRLYSAIDGGVAVNNPTACAVADALGDGYAPENIKVLSLGTGSCARSISLRDARERGTIEWALLKLHDLFIDAQQDVHRYIAERMVGKQNILRLQFRTDNDIVADLGVEEDITNAGKGNLRILREAAQRMMAQWHARGLLEQFFDTPAPKPPPYPSRLWKTLGTTVAWIIDRTL